MERKFKVIRAEVGGWSTSFLIRDLTHKNQKNSMSPEAFFHHLGGLCGKNLQEIEGLEFDVVLSSNEKLKEFDPLDLCGETITVK